MTPGVGRGAVTVSAALFFLQECSLEDEQVRTQSSGLALKASVWLFQKKIRDPTFPTIPLVGQALLLLLTFLLPLCQITSPLPELPLNYPSPSLQ
jgi:hypothetical protein